MKGWFSASDLAALCLPGLPASREGLYLMARREGWDTRVAATGEPLARRRSGKGGGVEYHVSILPAPARIALSARATKIDSLAPQSTPRPMVAGPHPDTPARILRRDARLVLVSMADQHFRDNRSLGKLAADCDFVERFRRSELTVPAWVGDQLGKVSVRSIARWRKARDSGNIHAVGGEGRKSRSVLEEAEEGDVATYIAALLIKNQFLSAVQLKDLVEERFGRMLRMGTDEMPLPHERSFQRFITSFKSRNAAALTAATNPDRYKSHMRFAGSDAYAAITRLNELWEIDASPADVLLLDGRHSIYVLVDVYSRRLITHVSKTARTDAALALLRKAIIAWGVPDMLRTDNGSDFTSHAFKRAVHSLAIVHDVTAPFSPEQKGIVERAIKTLQHKWISLLPGFIGHNVADRKQIEERKAFAQRLGEDDSSAFRVELSLAAFQRDLDRWASEIYAHATHAGIGTTPFLRAQSALGAIRTISNHRALDLLLSPIQGGWRTVTKSGIRLDDAHYISSALQAGTRVFCRQDPEDMGRLFVFDDEHGAFICEAVCPARAGVDPREAVARVRIEQKRIVADQLKEARAEARKIKPGHMAEAMLRLAERNAPNVMPFPRRTAEHESDALIHAANAVDEGVSTGLQSPFEQLVREVEAAQAPASNVHVLPETAKQRFQRAIAIKDAIAASMQVSPEDARWLGSYELSSEFQSMAPIFESHGREWLNA